MNVRPKTMIFESSANPMVSRLGSLASSLEMGVIYRMNRIGDSGDPCGTPARMGKGCED